jgi:hypothetical protein
LSNIEAPYAETTCEVRTTPLRAFNANVGILYVALAVIAAILAWFSSTKSGAATFDSNVYRLSGHYVGNDVVPPAGATSMVTLTPWGTALALMGALIIGAMFHFVYAADCRRMYTLLLIDRCNGMRWAQFGIIHTILALIVAQILGTTTFDFLMFALLALPCLGILGYFGDKSYPCCPCMSNVVIVGTALIMLAYWIPVITNFAYRVSDSRVAAPPYMWIALFLLLFYDAIVLVAPIIQARCRLSYFLTETINSIGLVVISAVILICVGWALADQNSV